MEGGRCDHSQEAMRVLPGDKELHWWSVSVEKCRTSTKERQLAEIGVVDRPAARTELRPGPTGVSDPYTLSGGGDSLAGTGALFGRRER